MKKKREQIEPTFPEPDMKQTMTRIREETHRRRQELQTQLEINANFNVAIAQAMGIDTSKFPAKLRRDLEKQSQSAFKAKPPPLAKN